MNRILQLISWQNKKKKTSCCILPYLHPLAYQLYYLLLSISFFLKHYFTCRESHYNYFAYPMLHQREAKTWWHIHFCKYTWFTWYSQYIHHHLFSPTLLCSFTSLVTGNNRRTISEMCFCTKDIRLSAEVKNYIKDIAPFLQPSDKFYVTAINATFMKEGRVVKSLAHSSFLHYTLKN